MSKERLALRVQIPPYHAPRNKWREKIYQAVEEKRQAKDIQYPRAVRLEVHVHLYLKGKNLLITDVDNRLKDVLDALQTRMGGSKKVRKHTPIIPNDNQIYRVIIEKSFPPKQSLNIGGHLIIRKYKARTPKKA